MNSRINLTPSYSISRVIKGHWQLSEGHVPNSAVDVKQALHDMHQFVDAGITTFDVADIYTGAEELIGQFLKDKPSAAVQVHTKYVPDMAKLQAISFSDTQTIIERSLARLGVETLDLVQFHWWDYAVGNYVEVALHLQQLKQQGKIRNIGVTNFDAAHLKPMLEAGVKILTTQNQYSVLDRRPEKGFIEFCQATAIHMLCYGTLCGGFISPKWIGQPQPDLATLENRSLTKYALVIDEVGGWNAFQTLLQKLDAIGKVYGVTLSEVASAYILTRPQVAAAIIGAHNAKHLARVVDVLKLELSASDIRMLETYITTQPNLRGDVYELERNDPTHKGIMKVNLNENKPS